MSLVKSSLISVICLLVFVYSPLSLAINVMPFSGELDLTEQPNYKIKVSNNGQKESAVKISVQKWHFDEFGEEVREPTNDLIIFPKRLLLSPGAERSVRVSYRKGLPPRIEETYRITVEEIPLKKNQRSRRNKGASINVLTRYVTAFYVKPRDAESIVKVMDSNVMGLGFQVKLRNEGNAHTHFISPSMTIRQSGKKLIITDLELLKPFTNTNLFGAADRIFEWEVPESFQETLDFDRPYKVHLNWVCENCSDKTQKVSFVVEAE